MKLTLNTSSLDDYKTFLAIKRLPAYRFVGSTAIFPDEYKDRIGREIEIQKPVNYSPKAWLYDYQRDISRKAIEKRKFCIFADCGLGKTGCITEFIRHASKAIGPRKCSLIISPLMVIPQTIAEAEKFYGKSLKIEQVKAADLKQWLASDGSGKIGITNYDALTDDLEAGCLGALALDESSMLKSHYGKWGTTCIRLGKGIEWKLAVTGTPAPNDRIEYANHAVFVDAFPTVNSFLARFFVNRGQTDNRWELKPHALKPFYRALSHWSIFLTNPATYGWKHNAESIPPIHVHIHDVELTEQQQDLVFTKTGTLFASEAGGITSRSVLSQIAKGNNKGEAVDTRKPKYIRDLVDSWPDESTIIWCHYNNEQDIMAKTFPEFGNISGDTDYEDRMQIIADFKAGKIRGLISKPKILGFGLNLQIATRQVFSGLQDSYEEYYQAVKRSNRIGSTRPLNVHIPITAIERPMIETVLRKAKRVHEDTIEQERIFKDASL